MLFLTVLTLLGQGQDMVGAPSGHSRIPPDPTGKYLAGRPAGAGGENDATHGGEIEPPNFR
jgi:hypothetical protein